MLAVTFLTVLQHGVLLWLSDHKAQAEEYISEADEPKAFASKDNGSFKVGSQRFYFVPLIFNPLLKWNEPALLQSLSVPFRQPAMSSLRSGHSH